MTNTILWILALVGLILIGIINTVLLPDLISNLQYVAPNAETVFDLSFYYSSDDAYRKINSFGPAGIPIVIELAKVDFVYIGIYTFTYFFFLHKLITHLYRDSFLILQLQYFPVVIGIFDVVENLGYLKMINDFPDKSGGLALLTTSATMVKWSLVVILGAFFVFLIWKLIKKKYFY